MSKRLIIDCDPGIDDAAAIFLALGSPELEVVALTTVFGNGPVEASTATLTVSWRRQGGVTYRFSWVRASRCSGSPTPVGPPTSTAATHWAALTLTLFQRKRG